jgi:hypothetical protein
MNNNRIYDYNKFAYDNPRRSNRGDYAFSAKLGTTDIFLTNLPDELSDISNIEAIIDYSVIVSADKEGIQKLNFLTEKIEIVVEKDKYPNDSEEIDIDIFSGQNIQPDRINSISSNCPIPSYPTRLEVDMQNSMNVENFMVDVYFGEE